MKQERELRCSKCGARAKATCSCGVGYITAREFAARALAANPKKSDRAIAAETGVSSRTLGRERKKSTAANAAVEKRQGRDGKVRRMPKSKPQKSWLELSTAQKQKIMSQVPSSDGPDDDDQTVFRRGLMFRAGRAACLAGFEQDWSRFTVDRELVDAVRQAAEAWAKLAAFVENIHEKSEGKAA